MSKIDEMLKNEKVEWKKLGDVCEISKGQQFNRIHMLEDGKYPVINGGISPSGFVNAFNTNKNCVTVSQGGASAGYVNFIETDFWLGAHAFSVIPINDKIKDYGYNYELFNRLIFNLLKIAEYSIQNKKEGAGIPSISKTQLSNIKVPFTSVKIQEKIVKFLEEFINHITALKKELDLRNKQYEYYRDKLLSEEYLNKLINKYDLYKYELKETTLGDLAQINRGASPRPISNFITNSEDGVPWIKISDARLNSKYINQTMQRITREGAKKSRLLKKGDFIISNSMSYGRPYILAIEGCIHDGWASISEYEENLNSDFLYHYLNSNKVQNYWLKKMNTSSVSNLNSDIIKSLPIPLIDKNLQAKIAEILDKFQAITQDISGSLPDEIEKREKQYEYYREKLLTFDTERTRGGTKY